MLYFVLNDFEDMNAPESVTRKRGDVFACSDTRYGMELEAKKQALPVRSKEGLVAATIMSDFEKELAKRGDLNDSITIADARLALYRVVCSHFPKA